MQHEIIDSTYNDDTQQILVYMGLKGVEEVNPPLDPLPGEPVDGMRWVRKVTETFIDKDLEVHSSVTATFGPGSTELYLYDVSRLPNEGLVVVNRSSATEEQITYTSRDVSGNRLLGISNPTYTHAIDELVYPSVDIDFLGAFEVDLRPFGVDNLRGPIRYNKTKVLLNGVTKLRENVDFTVVNDFSGNICIRTRLRFERSSQPTRFGPNDALEVEYEFFVLYGDTRDYIQMYTSPGIVSWVNLYERGVAGIAFGMLQSTEQTAPSVGNIRITPPFSNSILPPYPVKIVIPDTKLPEGVVTTVDITDVSVVIPVSDASRFPTLGTLLDSTDDLANRVVTINGNSISYSGVDKINNQLTGVSGIVPPGHSAGSAVEFDGARFTRDVVKNAINKSSSRGQVEALSVDTGGRYLRIRTKSSIGNFNLQPGTYRLSYLGFNDSTDRGIHKDITTTIPFENKELTFERYEGILKRQEIAKELLGQTVSKRTVMAGTNPIDVTFGVP